MSQQYSSTDFNTIVSNSTPMENIIADTAQGTPQEYVDVAKSISPTENKYNQISELIDSKIRKVQQDTIAKKQKVTPNDINMSDLLAEYNDTDGRIGEDIDLAQSAALQSGARGLNWLAKNNLDFGLLDKDYWARAASEQEGQELADRATGVKRSTREAMNASGQAAGEAFRNGNYIDYLGEVLPNVDRSIAESLGASTPLMVGSAVGSLAAPALGLTGLGATALSMGAGALLYNADRTQEHIESYKANHGGQEPTMQQASEMFLKNLPGSFIEDALLGKGLSMVAPKGLVRRVMGDGAEVFNKGIGKGAVKTLADIGLSAGTEGVQEAYETTMDKSNGEGRNVSEILSNPKDLQDIAYSGVTGGILGGIMTGVPGSAKLVGKSAVDKVSQKITEHNEAKEAKKDEDIIQERVEAAAPLESNTSKSDTATDNNLTEEPESTFDSKAYTEKVKNILFSQSERLDKAKTDRESINFSDTYEQDATDLLGIIAEANNTKGKSREEIEKEIRYADAAKGILKDNIANAIDEEYNKMPDDVDAETALKTIVNNKILKPLLDSSENKEELITSLLSSFKDFKPVVETDNDGNITGITFTEKSSNESMDSVPNIQLGKTYSIDDLIGELGSNDKAKLIANALFSTVGKGKNLSSNERKLADVLAKATGLSYSDMVQAIDESSENRKFNAYVRTNNGNATSSSVHTQSRRGGTGTYNYARHLNDLDTEIASATGNKLAELQQRKANTSSKMLNFYNSQYTKADAALSTLEGWVASDGKQKSEHSYVASSGETKSIVVHAGDKASALGTHRSIFKDPLDTLRQLIKISSLHGISGIDTNQFNGLINRYNKIIPQLNKLTGSKIKPYSFNEDIHKDANGNNITYTSAMNGLKQLINSLNNIQDSSELEALDIDTPLDNADNLLLAGKFSKLEHRRNLELMSSIVETLINKKRSVVYKTDSTQVSTSPNTSTQQQQQSSQSSDTTKKQTQQTQQNPQNNPNNQPLTSAQIKARGAARTKVLRDLRANNNIKDFVTKLKSISDPKEREKAYIDFMKPIVEAIVKEVAPSISLPIDKIIFSASSVGKSPNAIGNFSSKSGKVTITQTGIQNSDIKNRIINNTVNEEFINSFLQTLPSTVIHEWLVHNTIYQIMNSLGTKGKVGHKILEHMYSKFIATLQDGSPIIKAQLTETFNHLIEKGYFSRGLNEKQKKAFNNIYRDKGLVEALNWVSRNLQSPQLKEEIANEVIAYLVADKEYIRFNPNTGKLAVWNASSKSYINANSKDKDFMSFITRSLNAFARIIYEAIQAVMPIISRAVYGKYKVKAFSNDEFTGFMSALAGLTTDKMQKFYSDKFNNIINNYGSSQSTQTTQEPIVDTTKATAPETQQNVEQSTQQLITQSEYVNHSGGATGSDTVWGRIGKKYGVKSNHYYANGAKPNNNQISEQSRVKISDEELKEGIEKAKKANKTLQRTYPTKYEFSNKLIARDWLQVKNSDAIFAVSSFVRTSGNPIMVNGGTGWAVQMAIDLVEEENVNKPIYVFNQSAKDYKVGWYVYNKDYQCFIPYNGIPTLTKNFAGIGTRNINKLGIQAIRDVYEQTFNGSSKSTNTTNINTEPKVETKKQTEPQSQEPKQEQITPTDKKDTQDTQNTQNTQTVTNNTQENTSINYGKPENAFTGRGSDTWKGVTGDVLKVGGKKNGSKYKAGLLTRPGTAPNTWNGKSLYEWVDPEDGIGTYKAYSSNGSEYIFTDKGYSRRVKFVDPQTNGTDAGVSNWSRAFVVPKDNFIYKLLTGLGRDWFINNLGKLALTKDSTGKYVALIRYDDKAKKWKYVTLADTVTKQSSLDAFKAQGIDVNKFLYMPNNSIPTADPNVALIEFDYSDKGIIRSFHPSGGFAYVEHSNRVVVKEHNGTKLALDPIEDKDTIALIDHVNNDEGTITNQYLDDLKRNQEDYNEDITESEEAPISKDIDSDEEKIFTDKDSSKKDWFVKRVAGCMFGNAKFYAPKFKKYFKDIEFLKGKELEKVKETFKEIVKKTLSTSIHTLFNFRKDGIDLKKFSSTLEELATKNKRIDEQLRFIDDFIDDNLDKSRRKGDFVFPLANIKDSIGTYNGLLNTLFSPDAQSDSLNDLSINNFPAFQFIYRATKDEKFPFEVRRDVVRSLAIAAEKYIQSYEGSELVSGKYSDATIASLFDIADPDKNRRKVNEAKKFLYKVGIPSRHLVNTLGANACKMLGITNNPTTGNLNAYAKLQTNLGTIMLKYLEAAGYLRTNDSLIKYFKDNGARVTNDGKLAFNNLFNEFVVERAKAVGFISFEKYPGIYEVELNKIKKFNTIKINKHNYAVNTELFNEDDIKDILDTSGISDTKLTELTGPRDSISGSRVRSKVTHSNNIMNVGSYLRTLINNLNKVPYTIDTKNVDLIREHLGELLSSGALGTSFSTERDTKSMDASITLEGQNSQLIKEIQYLLDFAEYQTNNNNNWFFDYFVSRNMRFQIKSNTLNPQGNKKLHRFLCLPTIPRNPKTHKVTDPDYIYHTDPEKFNDKDKRFEDFCIAQAFDTLGTEDHISDIGDAFRRLNADQIHNMKVALLTNSNDKFAEILANEILNTAKNDTEKEQLKELLFKDDKSVLGIENFGQVLHTFSHLENRANCTTDTFESNLCAEIDSTTSGFFIRLLQFPDPEILAKYGKALGIFPDPEQAKELFKGIEGFNYEEYKKFFEDNTNGKPSVKPIDILKKSQFNGFMDIYRMPAKAVAEELGRLNKLSPKAKEEDETGYFVQFRSLDESSNDIKYINNEALHTAYYNFISKFLPMPEEKEEKNPDGTTTIKYKVGSKLRALFKPIVMVFGYNGGKRTCLQNAIEGIRDDFVSDILSSLNAKSKKGSPLVTAEIITDSKGNKKLSLKFSKSFSKETKARLGLLEHLINTTGGVADTRYNNKRKTTTSFEHILKMNSSEEILNEISNIFRTKTASEIQVVYDNSNYIEKDKSRNIIKYSVHRVTNLDDFFYRAIENTYGKLIWDSLESDFRSHTRILRAMSLAFNNMQDMFIKVLRTETIKLAKEFGINHIPLEKYNEMIDTIRPLLPAISPILADEKHLRQSYEELKRKDLGTRISDIESKIEETIPDNGEAVALREIQNRNLAEYKEKLKKYEHTNKEKADKYRVRIANLEKNIAENTDRINTTDEKLDRLYERLDTLKNKKTDKYKPIEATFEEWKANLEKDLAKQVFAIMGYNKTDVYDDGVQSKGTGMGTSWVPTGKKNKQGYEVLDYGSTFAAETKGFGLAATGIGIMVHHDDSANMADTLFEDPRYTNIFDALVIAAKKITTKAGIYNDKTYKNNLTYDMVGETIRAYERVSEAFSKKVTEAGTNEELLSILKRNNTYYVETREGTVEVDSTIRPIGTSTLPPSLITALSFPIEDQSGVTFVIHDDAEMISALKDIDKTITDWREAFKKVPVALNNMSSVENSTLEEIGKTITLDSVPDLSLDSVPDFDTSITSDSINQTLEDLNTISSNTVSRDHLNTLKKIINKTNLSSISDIVQQWDTTPIGNKLHTIINSNKHNIQIDGESTAAFYTRSIIGNTLEFSIETGRTIDKEQTNKYLRDLMKLRVEASKILSSDTSINPKLYEDMFRSSGNTIEDLSHFASLAITDPNISNKLKVKPVKTNVSIVDRVINAVTALFDSIFKKGKLSDAVDALKGEQGITAKQTIYDSLSNLLFNVDLTTNTLKKQSAAGNLLHSASNIGKALIDPNSKANEFIKEKVASFIEGMQYSTEEEATVGRVNAANNMNKYGLAGIPSVILAYLRMKEGSANKNIIRRNIGKELQKRGLSYLNSFLKFFVKREFGSKDFYIKDIESLAANARSLDQIREAVSSEAIASIISGYPVDSKGNTTLTIENRSNLTKGFARTDAQSLLYGSKPYTEKQFFELLANSDKRKKELERIENELHSSKELSKEDTYLAILKSELLAKFMVTGKGSVLIGSETTAYKIAKECKGSPVSSDIVDLIDKHITLTAMQMTDQSVFDNLLTLSKEGNINTLKNLRSYHETVLKNSMFNTGFNLGKGYHRRLLDSSYDVVIAPIEDTEFLKSRGYKLITTGKTSAYSKNLSNPTPTIGVFRQSFTISNKRDGAAFLNAGKEAVGRGLYSTEITDAQKYKEAISLERAALEKSSRKSQLRAKDLEKFSTGFLVDMKNDKYESVVCTPLDYNEMSKYLRLDDDFLSVFGSMQGSAKLRMDARTVNDTLLNYLEEVSKNANIDPNTGLDKQGRHWTLLTPDSYNERVKKSWSYLPKEIQDRIGYISTDELNESIFKLHKEIYIRDDALLDVFGAERLSLSNLSTIDKMLHSPEAKGLIKTILRGFEYYVKFFASGAKRNIVMLLPKVLTGNIVSNVMYHTLVHAISPIKGLRMELEMTQRLRSYLDTRKELGQLIYNKNNNVGNQTNINKKIAVLQDKLTQDNVIHTLISNGMYQSIIEDLTVEKLENAGAIQKTINENKYIKNMPNAVKTGIKNLYMVEGTPIFDFMNRITQYSDFVARAVEYQLCTEELEKNLDSNYKKYLAHVEDKQPLTIEQYKAAKYKEMIADIRDAFVNYDKPHHEYLQYANSMGVAMFTKYGFRIQRVIAKAIKHNPIMSMFMFASNYLPMNLEDITEQNAFQKHWGALFPRNPIDNFISTILPPPVQYFTGRMSLEIS